MLVARIIVLPERQCIWRLVTEPARGSLRVPRVHEPLTAEECQHISRAMRKSVVFTGLAIRQIEAVLQLAPYGMNSGWSSWEDGLSSTARDVTK